MRATRESAVATSGGCLRGKYQQQACSRLTAEANHKTQHGVPELETADAVGLSGSIVWRTAVKRLTPEELAAKIRNTEAGRAKRKAAKVGKRAQKRTRA